MGLHYADIRVNVRVYFKDNGLDALPDQAIENFDCLAGLSEVDGEMEIGGIEVARVFDPEGNPIP